MAKRRPLGRKIVGTIAAIPKERMSAASIHPVVRPSHG